MTTTPARELEARVRDLVFKVRRPVNNLLHGAYASRFHGSGLEFAEMREYVPGDDVRHIDWNASSRSGRTFVKHHIEERNLTALFVVDVSGSSRFRASGPSRLERFAELVGLLGFCANRHRDRCGLVTATDRVVTVAPPAGGAAHVEHLMRTVLAADSEPVAGQAGPAVPLDAGSDLRPALRMAASLMRRRGLVFVLSDFLLPEPMPELGALASAHEVGGLRLLEPLEWRGPAGGLFRTVDPESGRLRVIDGRDARTRQAWTAARRQQAREVRGWFDRAGAELLTVTAEEDPAEALYRWFHHGAAAAQAPQRNPAQAAPRT